MEKENIRGKLLYRGVTGKYYDTIGSQVLAIIFITFSICLMVVLAFCTILFNWTLAGSSILGSAIWLFLAANFIILLYACGGIDINGIYEYGISSAYHNLIDYLKGRTFHRYENITKIGYGTHKFSGGLETSFISIFENNENEPSTPAYHKYRYKNDFYDKLIETLRQKIPNVQWVEIDYSSLPFTKG